MRICLSKTSDKVLELNYGNRYVKPFNLFNQFFSMPFFQLIHRGSLHDDVICLISHGPIHYHIEIRRWMLVTHSRMFTENLIGTFKNILVMLWLIQSDSFIRERIFGYKWKIMFSHWMYQLMIFGSQFYYGHGFILTSL